MLKGTYLGSSNRKEALRLLENNWEPTPGKMYEVSINAHPDQFLDWNKPLSEHPPEIQSKLSDFSPHMSGAQINESARLVPGEYRNNKISREEFMKRGIPGIKYLDQGSRAAGDGSRNYVVFDDKLISIVKKYGIAGGLMLGAITQQQANDLKAQGY